MGMDANMSTITMNGVTRKMDDVIDRRGCGKWEVENLILPSFV
jgi:hypothetical protein